MFEKIRLQPKMRHGIQIGILLVVSLLPVFFNPLAAGDLEPTRVVLFLVIVLGMLLCRIVARVAVLPPVQGSSRRLRIQLPSPGDLWQSNPLAIPVLVYGMVHLVSTMLSVAPLISWLGNGNLHGMIATSGVVVFFLLAADALRSWEELDRLITVLLLVSLAIVTYGFAQYLGLDPLQWRAESLSPVQSTLGLTVTLGAYLLLVLPFSLARTIGVAEGDRRRRGVYGLVVILQLMGFVFTLARGAVLGWTIASALFCWLVTQRLSRPRRIALVIAVVLIGILLFIFVYRWGVLALPASEVTLNRLEEGRAASNTMRATLWKTSMRLLPDSMLFGYGPETFSRVYLSQDPSSLEYEIIHGVPLDPHNIFIYQLWSAGICGFLAFLWLLIAFYRVTISALHRTTDGRQRGIVAAITASATGYLVQAQFHPDGIVPWSLLWLVFALGVTVHRLTRR